MAKRKPRSPRAPVPTATYTDRAGDTLELRAVLTPATRLRYADTLHGGLNQEDARARAVELLFEHLAVAWTISGVAGTRQKELLGRYRMASGDERAFVLTAMREHLAEHFPEMEAP
jgi:hypothetical protein